MELKLQEQDGATIEVQDSVFGQDFNEALIHQTITAYMARSRAGTKAQKTRSEVRGGGAKPWRQKGTGRARAGTIRSPIWRTGGVTFAAKPKEYKVKLNKKMYRSAVRSILSELLRQERLHVVDSFELDQPKTKDLANRLSAMSLNDVLIVTENESYNLYLSSRNLVKTGVVDVDNLDPVRLVGYSNVLFTVPALRKVEESLK